MTSGSAAARQPSGQTVNSAGRVPCERASSANRVAQSRRSAWLSGNADGPCCITTTSHRPSPSAHRASPLFQWSSRLKPPKATVRYSSLRPVAEASAATCAGRSFVAVRLFPTNRTRRLCGGVAAAEPAAKRRTVRARAPSERVTLAETPGLSASWAAACGFDCGTQAPARLELGLHRLEHEHTTDHFDALPERAACRPRPPSCRHAVDDPRDEGRDEPGKRPADEQPGRDRDAPDLRQRDDVVDAEIAEHGEAEQPEHPDEHH